MVLNGVQYLHSSPLKCPSKEWILSAGNANDMLCYFFPHQWLHVFLPFLCAPQNSNEKRKPKRVKWVYDHLGRLWMSFRCRSDVVSDVVQIAGGIQKFDILLCDRSKHSDTSGRTGLWKLKMAHVGWKWKTKQNRMWFSQTPIYVYVWFGCRFRCRSRCRSPPKWTTLKTV